VAATTTSSSSKNLQQYINTQQCINWMMPFILMSITSWSHVLARASGFSHLALSYAISKSFNYSLSSNQLLYFQLSLLNTEANLLPLLLLQYATFWLLFCRLFRVKQKKLTKLTCSNTAIVCRCGHKNHAS
jgi:hypothetical protein